MGLLSGLFGGSKSSSSPSTVWGTQAPFLQGLYQRAYNGSLGLGTGGPLVGNAAASNPTGGGGRGGLIGPWGLPAGGGRRGTQPVPAAGGGATFGDPLSAFGASIAGQGSQMLGNLGMLGQFGNPYVQGQIGQLGQGLGRLYSQQIAPTINSTFAAGGTYGGDRQALALGQAAEGLGQQFTSGALDLLGNSAQLALNANQAGLAGLGSVFQAGNNALFGSLPGLSSLLGGPAILGGGSQTNSSNGVGGVLSGLGSMGLMFCAVARLVFGPDNPEWVQFWQWKERRPWFKRLYDRHCFRVADWLADKPRLQAVVRRWMRARIREG